MILRGVEGGEIIRTKNRNKTKKEKKSYIINIKGRKQGRMEEEMGSVEYYFKQNFFKYSEKYRN